MFDMPVKWGIDLQAEHEKYLCEVYCKNRPVFVTHYPEAIKPFYMKRSSNDTVEAMDLLVPRLVREFRREVTISGRSSEAACEKKTTTC